MTDRNLRWLASAAGGAGAYVDALFFSRWEPWTNGDAWRLVLAGFIFAFALGAGSFALCVRGLLEKDREMAGVPRPRRQFRPLPLADPGRCPQCGSRTWIPAGKRECCGLCGGPR